MLKLPSIYWKMITQLASVTFNLLALVVRLPDIRSRRINSGCSFGTGQRSYRAITSSYIP